MKTSLKIKNFRVFDSENGGTINLAPITLLTGCNSSGKSSFAKALLLLKSFFCQMEYEKFADCKLDFLGTAKLGMFDLARNNKSREGSKMTFSYTIHSGLLDEDVDIELTFIADTNDVLNNGWLCDILIKKLDGTIILDAMVNRDKKENLFANHKYGKLVLKVNNLLSIKNNYLAATIKYIAFDALYSHENELPDKIDLLKSIVTPEQFDRFVNRLNEARIDPYFDYSAKNHKDSPFWAIAPLFDSAVQQDTLFPMPIWKALDGIAKCDVRKTFHNWIAEAESRNRRNGVEENRCAFEYIEFLDQILTWFEESEHCSLLSYFVAEEKKWLQDITLQEVTSEYIFDDIGIYELDDFKKFPIFNGDGFGGIFFTLHLADKFIGNEMGVERQEYMKSYKGSWIEGSWHDDSNGGHWVFAYLRDFYSEMLAEVLSPAMFKGVEYVPDSAILSKRVYTADDKQDAFTQTLFEYADVARKYAPKEEAKVDLPDELKGETMYHTPVAGEYINKWVKKFELGDRISITSTAEGLGLIVKLHKTPEDIGVFLADEGLGITKLLGTLINVELEILKNNERTTKGITIAVEEPENHLHPKFQSLLAEMFTDAYKNYGIHFIVETHSEYMVRKLQVLVARKELTPKEVSLQYFYNPNIEQRPQGEPQVKDIPIREDGILLAPFGPGFLDEADNLVTDILTLKAMS
ncbi:MAG: AAA family ATPase [Tidjanibacter sp.]|nr:AAA family ATPase [Tidjanibacter sp.]